MKHITFYFDFISPYSYLAFEHLPRALEGISHSVEYRPVLFAGMLKAHGQLGPAEIAPKRVWTYREVLWLAHRHGIDMAMPAAHPFNPLPLLRLAVACGDAGAVNRQVCEAIFRHVWCGGHAADDPTRLQVLSQALLQQARERKGADADPASDAVKDTLRRQTEEAIAQGVFGVPMTVADGRHFWGFDALPMLHDALLGDPWFDGPAWGAPALVATGVRRDAVR